MSDPWKSLAPELPGLMPEAPGAHDGETSLVPVEVPEPGSPAHDPERVDQLAKELLSARHLLAEAQATVRRAEQKVIASMHQSFGEVPCTARGHGYTLSVTRPEKWHWDKEALLGIVGGIEMPTFISTSLRVNRKRFEALPQEEKERFTPALTVEVGSWTLEVAPVE